jgi:hypothetical protein
VVRAVIWTDTNEKFMPHTYEPSDYIVWPVVNLYQRFQVFCTCITTALVTIDDNTNPKTNMVLKCSAVETVEEMISNFGCEDKWDGTTKSSVETTEDLAHECVIAGI